MEARRPKSGIENPKIKNPKSEINSISFIQGYVTDQFLIPAYPEQGGWNYLVDKGFIVWSAGMDIVLCPAMHKTVYIIRFPKNPE